MLSKIGSQGEYKLASEEKSTLKYIIEKRTGTEGEFG